MKGRAAAHAACIDDTVDVEPHDSDSAPVDDTTEHNQGFNEHEESSYDADSNPCSDEISEDNPEDELEPWVDNAQSGPLVSMKRNLLVDPEAEPDSLVTGKDDCQTPR